jgi:hypothetical protein
MGRSATAGPPGDVGRQPVATLAPGRRARYRSPMPDDPRPLTLHLAALDGETLDELERALLKARATELGEVRRRQARLITGYGDPTTREVMDDEGRRAQRRYDALTSVIDALRAACGGVDST